MEIRAIWRRKARVKMPRRLAMAAVELSDSEVARISRGNRIAEVEAGQMRDLLRAGGAVMAHR